jgi:hypothetical protein
VLSVKINVIGRSRTRLDLEIKKKELTDTLMLQNAQLVDLGQTIAYHQNTIESRKEQHKEWRE